MRQHRPRPITLLATIGLAATATLGVAAGVDAKAASLLPMPCSAGTAAHAVFSRQGADYRIGMGASGAGSLGTWHATEIDNGSTVLIDDTYSFGVPQWDILSFATLAKGTHVLSIRMENLTTGETCSTSITSKI